MRLEGDRVIGPRGDVLAEKVYGEWQTKDAAVLDFIAGNDKPKKKAAPKKAAAKKPAAKKATTAKKPAAKKPAAKKPATKKNKGIAWGGVYWQYFEDLDKITSAETPLSLNKKLFLFQATPN